MSRSTNHHHSDTFATILADPSHREGQSKPKHDVVTSTKFVLEADSLRLMVAEALQLVVAKSEFFDKMHLPVYEVLTKLERFVVSDRIIEITP
ncbi:hypothetical protein Scep_014711 [Stephania cephalantha]|uniref:Uncharacterized protein n=1 Tax=Stephania cephalantha TaxID=152367 RepID=A0AAP0J364_9MAGN